METVKVAVTVFAVTLSPDSELLMTVILTGVRFSNSHVDPVSWDHAAPTRSANINLVIPEDTIFISVFQVRKPRLKDHQKTEREN